MEEQPKKRVIMLTPEEAEFQAKKQRLAEINLKTKAPAPKRKKASDLDKWKNKQKKPKPIVETNPLPVVQLNRNADTPKTEVQKVVKSGLGSRSEVEQLKMELIAVAGRLERENRLMYAALIRAGIPVADAKRHSKPYENILISVRETINKIDSVFLSTVTLTAIESARWRQLPNSRLIGLRTNAVEIERMQELAKHLAQTPIPAEDPEKEAAYFNLAFAEEVKNLLDSATPRELVIGAQTATMFMYQQQLEKFPVLRRPEIAKKLDSLRDLQAEVAKLFAPKNATGYVIADPLAGCSIVPS